MQIISAPKLNPAIPLISNDGMSGARDASLAPAYSNAANVGDLR
jgi:hypothetical protein